MYLKNLKIIKKSFFVFFVNIIFVCSFFHFAEAASVAPEDVFPKRANYYLGELHDTETFIRDIARYDLLILTPAQIQSHASVIKKIRSSHPGIIILGYVPSQSYNLQYWSTDSVFRNFKNIPDSAWLLNSQGEAIVDSYQVKWANMSPEWSSALLSFTKKNILTLDLDGIFFDMVSHNISWLNAGDIDINRDGKRDDAAFADKIWLERTTSFLQKASETLQTKYIVINGSSHTNFQKSVNGRMFETFPTPWEGDGTWSTVLTNAKNIKKNNKSPRLLVFNGNSNNTGVQNNYKSFRFGFVSSLFEDAYFSYDFGDRAHSQLWWYDEYNSKLGKPVAPAFSYKKIADANTVYAPGVWMRPFENAVAVVNSTDNTQLVDLGGEYEKFHGTQDPRVNDGSIVNETEVDARDGLILLRTFSTVQDALYTNGDFVRFFRPDGSRVRNGFFVFDEKYKGGEQIAQVDIDGNGRRDLVVVSKNKVTVWRDDAQLFAKLYPYGPAYAGKIRLSFGDFTGDGKMEIIVAPSDGYALPIQIYSRFGDKIKDDWFPFGKQYKGGYTVAILAGAARENGKIVIGTGIGKESVVQIYDFDLKLLKEWFAFERNFKGGANVAVGDVDGDAAPEIVVGAGKGKKPLIRIFDQSGVLKYKEFAAYSSFGTPGIDVRVVDVDFDGKLDILGMSDSF